MKTTAVLINVISNDTDVDGDSLTVDSVSTNPPMVPSLTMAMEQSPTLQPMVSLESIPLATPFPTGVYLIRQTFL